MTLSEYASGEQCTVNVAGLRQNSNSFEETEHIFSLITTNLTNYAN